MLSTHVLGHPSHVTCLVVFTDLIRKLQVGTTRRTSAVEVPNGAGAGTLGEGF